MVENNKNNRLPMMPILNLNKQGAKYELELSDQPRKILFTE